MPRAPKKCGRTDCEERVPNGGRYCPVHLAEKQQRPSPSRRGYDRAHTDLRRRWAPLVATGDVTCWRCGELIAPNDEWHLGHDDHDRSVTRGPEHARRCNLRAAGIKSHRIGQ